VLSLYSLSFDIFTNDSGIVPEKAFLERTILSERINKTATRMSENKQHPNPYIPVDISICNVRTEIHCGPRYRVNGPPKLVIC
jgi:hypothetical protein